MRGGKYGACDGKDHKEQGHYNHKPRAPRRGIQAQSTYPGSEYTPEEIEFLQALDAHRRRTGHKFPSWIEALDLLRQLGWTPPARPPPLPLPAEDEPTVPTAQPETGVHQGNRGVHRNSRQPARGKVRLLS